MVLRRLALSLLLSSCAAPRARDVTPPAPTASARTADAAPPTSSAAPAPAPTLTLARADHDFALRFYATERGRPGNLFFSPASLRVALAMVFAGAHGETAAQMSRALGFSPDAG